MTEATDTWPDWLRRQLAGRPNAHLVRAAGLKENGRPVIDDSRVSKWLKGEQHPSMKLVLVAADALGADRAEALSAAGYAPSAPMGAPLEIPDRVRGVRSMEDLFARVDEVQAEFERAIANLATAEGEFDSVMRYWAGVELLRERVNEIVDERERVLGRSLTPDERHAVAGQLSKPTASEIAEFVAWAAMHDVREWTRLEMALIERIFDYPQDGRVGSGYADIEPFRERVRRLGFRSADDSGEPRNLPTKLTPLYQGTPEFLTSADASVAGGDGDADSTKPGGSAPTTEPPSEEADTFLAAAESDGLEGSGEEDSP